jgi:arylsulfatase A-like enzyme
MKINTAIFPLATTLLLFNQEDAVKRDGFILSATSSAKPNVILIMADDLGWGDVGFNGYNKVIKTPALDEMAESGIVFTRLYAACSVCSPTRGSCLTGRNPFRYGIETANDGRMLPQEFTLAEYMKQKGYCTGHFGKWHLGTLTKTEKDGNRGGNDTTNYSPPWENGFDVCFSTESKVPTWDPMVTPGKSAGDIGQQAEGKPFGTWYWTGPEKKETDNLQGDDSRIIMDRVIPYLEGCAAKKQPFLAVVWFHTPHLPVLTGEKYRNLYKDKNLDIQHYYGAISAMDEQIGRLNNKLKELKLNENTLVFFTGDNGPEGPAQQGRTQGSTGGFRGRKRSLYEGGIRVPGLIVWPAMIKGGQKTNFPAITSDYYPTILEIMGDKNQFPVTPVDGISLMEVLTGKMTGRPASIGFQFGNQKAMTGNRYKLYVQNNKTELYDLINDPFETKDISNENPEIVADLKYQLNDFVKSCSNSSKGADYD